MAITATQCVCDSYESKLWATVNSIDIVECIKCGIKRVSLIDKHAYTDLYASGDYHSKGSSDLPHESADRQPHAARTDIDIRVAELRLKKLAKYKTAGELIDVGCANGAFMLVAEEAGFRVEGVDLSKDAAPKAIHDIIRRGDINEVGFQRRSADVIVFNDSFEHFIDPVHALRAARGILKRDGLLVIENPDMGSADAISQGANFKHIKPHEHLWYFTATQLRQLLENSNFTVVGMDIPLPGKVTIYASPACTYEEVTVMGPPGIGDTLWTLHKLKSIYEKEYPCRLKYIVSSDPQDKPSTRAKDFLLLSPYIDSVDFKLGVWPMDVGCKNPSYPHYELTANDFLEPGGGLIENWRPELQSDFDLCIEVPYAATQQVRWRLQKTGQYAILYFSSFIWNRITTLPEWTPKNWANVCIALKNAGITPVILGAPWDTDYADAVAMEISETHDPNKIWINAIGKTSITLAMAYMKQASCTIGICAGLPMIAGYFGWSTVILWPTAGVSGTPTKFGPAFRDNWLPPEVRHSGSYTGLDVGNFTEAGLVGLIEEICHKDRRYSNAHSS